MLVSIHLVARLLRIPVLRVDGHVLLVDGCPPPAAGGKQPSIRADEPSTGRLLALAEAELAAIDRRRSRDH